MRKYETVYNFGSCGVKQNFIDFLRQRNFRIVTCEDRRDYSADNSIYDPSGKQVAHYFGDLHVLNDDFNNLVREYIASEKLAGKG